MSDDKIKFYNIEAPHLTDLKQVAHRLLSTVTVNTDEMRDLAVKIMTVVNYAEVLDTFRKPGNTIRVESYSFSGPPEDGDK